VGGGKAAGAADDESAPLVGGPGANNRPPVEAAAAAVLPEAGSQQLQMPTERLCSLMLEYQQQQTAGRLQQVEEADGGTGAGAAQRAALDSAWSTYVCPGNPGLWASAKPMLPEVAQWVMQRLHPSDMFPAYYPALPPGFVNGTAQIPLVVPVLRPAAAAPAAAAATQEQQAVAAQQAVATKSEAEQPRAAAEPLAAAASARAAWFEDDKQDEELSADASLLDSSCCCCLQCCGYYDSSPESEKVQPGKRIKWRCAIATADPVRRNLMPVLRQAAAAAAPAALAAAAPAAVPAAGPATRKRRQRR
jgi:hypothetical protein